MSRTRQDFLQKDWWYAKEAQDFLAIGYQAFIRFLEAESIRTRLLPGAAFPQYSRVDIEMAEAKYITFGAPRVKKPHWRTKQKTAEELATV